MDPLSQFLLDVTYMELVGDRWNVLGVFWLLVLTNMAYQRFRGHFINGHFPKPAHNSRSLKGDLWELSVLIFAFLSTMLLQMVVDDFITTPINLAYGSWSLLSPHMGDFSFLKLLAFKWDVYALICIYSLIFWLTGIWKFYQFTWKSALFLSLTVVFQVWLGSNHVFYFLNLSGYERLYTFWVSYPWFRILTGALGVSLIKKPERYG